MKKILLTEYQMTFIKGLHNKPEDIVDDGIFHPDNLDRINNILKNEF